MAHTHGHTGTLKNPGAFQVPGTLRMGLLALAILGGAAFGGALMADPTRAWAAFVQNHFYFMSLAIGGLFFAAINWLTGAMWIAPMRRVCESFTAYLPVALIMFIILIFGMHSLYPWTHPEHVKGDLVLEGKAGYLNTTFFIIRNVVALGIWIYFAKKLVGNSIAQDASKDPVYTARNRTWTPVFLILFGITFTMLSFDLLMSLDPHWFSTMFGVYCFSGMFYSLLATMAVATIYLKNKGYLEGLVNENHLHDLGKYMFAFTVFWAYIGFSQFMLIWYANLPEETGYYLKRMHGGWMYVSLFLLVGKFIFPFFMLLQRDAKRNSKLLLVMGIYMMIAQWVDVLWLVQPEFFKDGPQIGWIELGVTLGFLGLFGLAVTFFLSKNTVVAIGDPKLEEAVFHHHQ